MIRVAIPWSTRCYSLAERLAGLTALCPYVTGENLDRHRYAEENKVLLLYWVEGHVIRKSAGDPQEKAFYTEPVREEIYIHIYVIIIIAC